MDKQKGIITIAGAGPGDPELLTVKALKRLRHADVVLYMGLKNIELIAGRLIRNGVSPDLPVCAASRVSMSDQQLIQGTLKTIGGLVYSNALATPVVFFLGEHVGPVSANN